MLNRMEFLYKSPDAVSESSKLMASSSLAKPVISPKVAGIDIDVYCMQF